MTLIGVLGMARNVANKRMTETVRVGPLELVSDPDTLEVEGMLTPVYSGEARVKFPYSTVSEREAAAQPVAAQDIILSLPGGVAYTIAPDMRVVVDASTADAGLVGRVFRVKGRPISGQTSAARYPVEETGEEISEGS
jgi:hypothetical protein